MNLFSRCTSFEFNKKLFVRFPAIFLTAILFTISSIANAQVNESEPNDSIPLANPLPQGVTLNAHICPAGFNADYDWFKIVPTTEGFLKFKTLVLQNTDSGGVTTLNWTLFNKTGDYMDSWDVASGSDSVFAADSFYEHCISPDTFYVRVYCPAFTHDCHTYSFSWTEILPAFNNDAEPDDDIQHAIPLAYNTGKDGHLNFGIDTTFDFYQIIIPTDGLLRIYLQAESQQDFPANMNVSVFDKNGGYVAGYEEPAGPDGVPLIDTIKLSCISPDTFYVRIYIDGAGLCGFSYRVSFDVKPAVFGNDPEPNDDAAQAVFFPTGVAQDGHQSYYGQSGSDWFKIYKTDTGNIALYTQASEEESDTSGFSVAFFDVNQSYMGTLEARIGTNGEIALDTLLMTAGNPDSFYLRVSFNNGCGSYRLLYANAPNINGIKKVTPLPNEVSVSPNPSSTFFNFRFSNIHAQRLELFDAEGRLMKASQLESSSNTFSLDANSFPVGFYYARIITSEGVVQFVKLSVAK